MTECLPPPLPCAATAPVAKLLGKLGLRKKAAAETEPAPAAAAPASGAWVLRMPVGFDAFMLDLMGVRLLP